MTRFLPAILLFFLTCTTQAQKSWELLNPTPTYETGRKILFVSDTKGYIINPYELLSTNDSGETWTKQLQLKGAADIHFMGNIGYIVGRNGYVLQSENNGDTWATVNTGSVGEFNSVQILDPETIIISGTRTIVRSDDGGVTWKSYQIPENYRVNKTFFTGALTGHAVCKNGFILKTVDGGQAWYVTESSDLFPNDFFTVHFVNEQLGFASRQHNDLLKTTDGGETWEGIEKPSDALYSFQFLDESLGFAVGDHGAVYKTTNGGNSWQWISFHERREDATEMYGLYFRNKDEGFITGQRGMIYKTLDGGATWAPNSPFYENISGLQLVTEEIGYASLYSNFFKTLDGGQTWTDIGGFEEEIGVSKFKFLDENTGYAIAGPNNRIYSVYKTTDGGKTWVKTNGGSDIMRDNLYSLDFMDDKVGFVSGGFNQKATFKTTNGGDSWTKVSDNSFRQIQFLDGETGFARGDKTYKTTDSGETWEVIFEHENPMTTMYIVNKEVGYLSSRREMFKTTDGGETWRKLEAPYLYYSHLKFYSANVGYALEDSGGIWETQDGGYSWEELTNINAIRHVSITPEKQIFLAGTYGKILKSSVAFDPYSLTVALAEEVLSNTAVLSGNASANMGTIEQLQFEYGTNSNFDKILSLTPGSVETNTSALHSVEVTELLPETTYHYRYKAKVDGKVVYSTAEKFITKPDYKLTLADPYVMATGEVALNGNVVSNKAEITEIVFQYGPVDDPFSDSSPAQPASVAPGTTANVKTSNLRLEPNTEYVARIKAVHEGEVIYSNHQNFKTHPEFKVNLYPASVGQDKVTFSASVTAYHTNIKALVFEYGTKEFEHEIGGTPAEVPVATARYISATLAGLEPGQTYYYRLRGSLGEKQIYSAPGLFNTSNEPAMVPEGAQAEEDNSVTITGLINPGGKNLSQIRFEYGINEQFDISVPARPDFLTGIGTKTVSAQLEDLLPGSDYSFRIKAVDGEEETVSESFSFKTQTMVQIPQDVLNMMVTHETCEGKNNGSLLIQAREEYDFTANINGETHSFTSELKLTHLPPGTYAVCITAVSASDFLQCFEFEIAAGRTMTGKAQVQRDAVGHSARIQIEQGTAPFSVSLNGFPAGTYDSSNFSLKVQQGDKLEITSRAACEGKFAMEIDLQGLTAYPNPASSVLNILLPLSTDKAVQIDIYNNSGKLWSSRAYQISNSVVSLPLDELASGIYFAVVKLETTRTIKFSKQ